MTGEERRCDVLVHGRVQGVGFRWWARRQAEALGLRGSVRNRADGTVEVHAIGGAAEVERFRAALERGPRAAVVEALEPVAPPDDPLPDGFRILV